MGAGVDVAGDSMVHLRGEQLPHHVVVVIDRGADDVDLAAIIGGIPAGGALHALVLFDQVPPQLAEVLAGVFIHTLFEPQHHLAPP